MTFGRDSTRSTEISTGRGRGSVVRIALGACYTDEVRKRVGYTMAWIYEIATGRLYDSAGAIVAIGYSGQPDHKNDPQSVSLHNQGPIPPGRYDINPPMDTVTHGPFVLSLTPDPVNQMFGRGGFLLHGDSVMSPGTASEGCVIMPRTIRELVWASGDRELHVMSQIPEEITSSLA